MNHPYKMPRSQAGSVIARRDTRRALRKSCDRCHEQKLRCDGSNASLASCQRCQRAGQTCVYSTRSPRQVPRNSNAMAKKTSDAASAYDPPRQAVRQEESTNGAGGIVLDALSLELSDFLASDHDIDWSFSGGLSSMDLPQAPPADLRDLPGPGMPGLPFSHVAGDAGDGELQEPVEDLWRISQALEEMLHCVTRTLRQQNIQRYPISEVFALFNRLREALNQPYLLHSRGPPEAAPDWGDLVRLRTKLLVVTCYVYCVKIMASIAESLFLDLSCRRAAASAQASSAEQVAQMAFLTPPNSEADVGNDYSGASTVNNTQGDFLLSDAFVRLDPLGHALSTACTTLRIGISQLREIEILLDIPQHQGVAAKTELNPNAPPGQGITRADASDPGSGSHTTTSSSSVVRLVGLLWEEEIPAPHSEMPRSTLSTLWHYRREISSLVREHLDQTSCI